MSAGDTKGRHIEQELQREEEAAAEEGGVRARGDHMRHCRAPVGEHQQDRIGRAVAHMRARIAGSDIARLYATDRSHTGGMPGRSLAACSGCCSPVPAGSSLDMSSHLGRGDAWRSDIGAYLTK